MRTYSFSSGDSGDKPVFMVSAVSPPRKSRVGTLGTNGCAAQPTDFLCLSPVDAKRVGTHGDHLFIELSPVSPVVPIQMGLDCSAQTTRLMSWSGRTLAAPEWRACVKPARAEA